MNTLFSLENKKNTTNLLSADFTIRLQFNFRCKRNCVNAFSMFDLIFQVMLNLYQSLG